MAESNDIHTTFAPAKPRLLRDVLALPCRAVRDGWMLPADGPEAA